MADYINNEWYITGPKEEIKKLKNVLTNNPDNHPIEILCPAPEDTDDDNYWGANRLSNPEIFADYEDELGFSFESAWMPPDKATDMIREMFPQLDFDCFWECTEQISY